MQQKGTCSKAQGIKVTGGSKRRGHARREKTQINEYSGTTQVGFYPTSRPTNYDMENKVMVQRNHMRREK